MEKYLKNTFGLNCQISGFRKKLPAYLAEDRKYEILTIDGQKFLLVEYAPYSFKLPQAKKQLTALQQYCDYPPIVVLPELSSYQRKVFIENRMAFIVPDKQIYIPNLGLSLGRTMPAGLREGSPKDEMTGCAQLVLTAYILGKIPDAVIQKDIAELLDINDMAVSRAIRELVDHGLLETKRKNTSVVIHPVASRKELFERAQQVMKNPVKRTKFILKKDLPTDVVLSGASALANQTMLGDPVYETYALNKKEYLAREHFDPDWTIEPDVVLIEEWIFDPAKTANNGKVDPVSLILEMGESNDERVEMAVEELKKRVFDERS